VLADPVGAFEVGEHQNVEQLGAGSGAKSVETSSESALELLGSHGLGAYRPFRYADPRSRTRTERADAAPRPV
jgi:hypothetical protein